MAKDSYLDQKSVARRRLGRKTQQLRAVLLALEWSNPTPDADNDGACPSCFAGKPMKFQVIPETFDPKNHMAYCKLAAALQPEDN